jgi:AhpD family alkylhydroperoxidase
VKALGGVYGYVMQSGLPAELVELVYLRVSQINNCAYCLTMHTRDLLKKGQKIEKLALVQAWAEAGNLFNERERTALAWAETACALPCSSPAPTIACCVPVLPPPCRACAPFPARSNAPSTSSTSSSPPQSLTSGSPHKT